MAQIYSPWSDPEEEDNVPGGLLSPMLMEPELELPKIEIPEAEDIGEPGEPPEDTPEDMTEDVSEGEAPEPMHPMMMHMKMMETMQQQTAIINKLLTLLTGKE
jgi:hypothetical protein